MCNVTCVRCCKLFIYCILGVYRSQSPRLPFPGGEPNRQTYSVCVTIRLLYVRYTKNENGDGNVHGSL